MTYPINTMLLLVGSGKENIVEKINGELKQKFIDPPEVSDKVLPDDFFAYATRIIRKINLRVRSDNHSAISLYKKSGFVSEGTITREFFINGKFFDAIHMGLEIE